MAIEGLKLAKYIFKKAGHVSEILTCSNDMLNLCFLRLVSDIDLKFENTMQNTHVDLEFLVQVHRIRISLDFETHLILFFSLLVGRGSCFFCKIK